MTNLSRPVKFPPDTLVKYGPQYRDPHVYVVDHNSGPDICWINHRDCKAPVPAPEPVLRSLYWYEFAFHRDPMKGHLMIGKNRALPLLYGFVVASLCSFAGFHWGASSVIWKCAASLPLAGVLAIAIIGTVRNAKGKQF
jgi:hypothetical protein